MYKKVMKAETYGAKYPENIPTSDYNKNGLVVKYMGKNKVKVTYNQVEGYAGFDFIINHDAKTKKKNATLIRMSEKLIFPFFCKHNKTCSVLLGCNM